MNPKVIVIETVDQWHSVLGGLFESPVLSVDTETVGLQSLGYWQRAEACEAEARCKQQRADDFWLCWKWKYAGQRYAPKTKQWAKFKQEVREREAALRETRGKKHRRYKPYGQMLNRVLVRGENPGRTYYNHLLRRARKTEAYVAALNKKAQAHPGGLHHWENILACVQLAPSPDLVYMIRPDVINGPELEQLLNSRQLILGQNFTFDIKQLKHHKNISLHCKNLHDTHFAEFLLTGGARGECGLKAIVAKRLGLEMDKEIRVSNWCAEWTPELVNYAALDVATLFPIAEQQQKELAADAVQSPQANLKNLFRLECLLSPVTAQMDLNGLRIDPVAFERFRGAQERLCAGRAHHLRCQLRTPNINLNSPMQVLEAFHARGLTELKSTEQKSIPKKYQKHPLIKAYRLYKRTEKMLGTYLSPFTERSVKEPKSWKLYGNFRQCGPETGRLSCDSPNLQNLPATVDFRSLFVARPGWVLVNGDLASIEPRILAFLTQDPVLIDAFLTGRDVYVACAALMFSVPLPQVTKELRKRAKAIFLGIIYGKTTWGLAFELGIPPWEAESLMARFLRQFPNVERYIKRKQAEALIHGKVRTLGGRIRRIHGLDSEDQRRVDEALRKIVNTIIQGSCADGVKLATYLFAKKVEDSPFKDEIALMALVHDEMLAECADRLEVILAAREMMKESMIEAFEQMIHDVPILVGDESSGWEPLVISNWGEAKKDAPVQLIQSLPVAA